jgi:hypothetical protein
MIEIFFVALLIIILILIFLDSREREKFDFYCAGPMRGKPNGNKETFLLAAKLLRRAGYTVWNPAEQNDGNMTFSECIVKDLDAIMHDCKWVVLLPGWENSLGANIELFTAHVSGKMGYEIDIFELEHNGKKHFSLHPFDIEKSFVLPFCPGTIDYRKRDEMVVPEDDIFSSTQ